MSDVRPTRRNAAIPRGVSALAVAGAVFLGLATGRPLAAPGADTGPYAESAIETLALNWFDRMRTGQIDRTQLSAQYDAQLTADAVQALARYLQAHDYGSPPVGAKLVQARTTDTQTFYIVKILFPRGDATALLIGSDRAGKITGISLMSMAGD